MFWVGFFLVSLVVSLVAWVAQLNRAHVQYEVQKLDQLAMDGSDAKAGFDLKSSLNKSKKVAQQVYGKTVATVGSIEYKKFWNSTGHFVSELRNNTWKTIRKIFSYFIHLTKPIGTQDEVAIAPKVVAQEPELQVDAKMVEVDSDGVIDNTYTKSAAGAKTVAKDDDNDATLNFVNKLEKDEEEMTKFEKLEHKILAKLQHSRMEDYGMWMELGELYMGFEQNDKANEVFAFVMKNGDESLQEKARNRLLEIS